jgi:nickel transport protein
MKPIKSSLAKPILYLCILISILCFRIESSNAHGVYVFAWVVGDTVFVESKFSGGKKVNAGKIIVTDSRGAELLSGTTNDQGEFSFKVPKRTELKIVLLAGAGHRAEWTIPVSEIDVSDKKTAPTHEKNAETRPLASSKSKDEPEASQKMVPLSGLTEKDLQSAVEEALEKKLQPVMKMLAEFKQEGPTVKDIFSGIGYIMGLVGIAAYIHSRKKIKSQKQQNF